MCNCQEETNAKFQEMYPTATYIAGQYELFSGRAYSEISITVPDKKKTDKETITTLLLSALRQKIRRYGGKAEMKENQKPDSITDRLDALNKNLMGAAGRMIVLSMSNKEIKDAHSLVMDASIEIDEIINELMEEGF